MQIIKSRDNEFFKNVRYLHAKSSRDDTGLFLIEGRKLILQAFKQGIKPVCIIVDEAALDSQQDFLTYDCKTAVFSSSLFLSISTQVTPDGAVAVAKKPVFDNAAITPGRYFFLDAIQDPGNMGAILRVVQAFNLDGVILGAGCADPFSPKCVRGSMGSVFKTKIYIDVDVHALSDFTLYASVLDKKAVRLQDIVFEPNCIIVIGNEGNGISDSLLEKCQKSLYIEIAGDTESLNAAVAAGIIAFSMDKSN